MSIFSRFRTIEESDKGQAVAKLVERATPDFDFFFMMTLAVFMATFGLIEGSETIVIGSMLIAPLLYPVLALALGVSLSDQPLMRRSFVTIGKATLYGIIASAAAALMFSTAGGSLSENEVIMSRTAPSLLFILVAIVSGFAVAYALVKPKLSEGLPGIAISVALIPPLAVIGIGIAWFDVQVIFGALATLVVNILGIVAAGSVSFSLMNVHALERVAEKTIVKEEKRVEKENIAVEKADKEEKDEASPVA